MKEENDDIGHLFRSAFDGHTEAQENGEWVKLQASLQRINFFRFNALQFNIYYAGSIIFCFLTCLAVGSHYTYRHFLSPEAYQIKTVSTSVERTQRTSNNSFIKSESKDLIREINNQQVSVNNSKQEKANDKSNLIKSKISEQINLSVLPDKAPINRQLQKMTVDTVKNPSQYAKDQIKEDSSKIKKRTVYITKQDTIYKYDTLRAPKPKRKIF